LEGLIHHSDRGVQYCSAGYVSLLRKNSMIISMTENGDPLENAIAERINGIIKGEYLENYEVNTLKVAKQLLEPFMLEHQIKMGRDALFDLMPLT